MAPEPEALVWREVNERGRTYLYDGGKSLHIANVKRLAVRPSGGHRIETTDGRKFVVRGDWLAIEVFTDEWTF